MTGPELQQLRKRLGVTGSEFAKAFEVHERTLRSWEGSIHKGRLVPVPRAVAILTRLALKDTSVRRELGLRPERGSVLAKTNSRSPSQ